MPKRRDYVFQRPRSPYWHYDFILQGHRVHGSVKTEQRSVAAAVVAKIRTDLILQTTLGQKPRMDLERGFLKYWSEDACRLPTANDIERGLKRLLIGLGNIGFHELNDAVVSTYVARRRADRVILRNGTLGEKLVSAGTVNRETDLLKAVCNLAQRRWGIEVGAVDWKAHRLREPAPRDRYLTPEEADRLMDSAAPHLKGPLLFALYTGARKATIEELDWSQIDMPARLVTFRQKSKIPGGKPHAVPLAEPLWLYLANLKPRDRGAVWLYRGRPLKDFNDAFRSACRRAGLTGFRFHDLRHTAASWMLRQRIPLKLVAEILGHADTRTTNRYAHVDPAAKTEAVAALATHWSRTELSPGPDQARIAIVSRKTPR
jgi:integrase